MDAIMDIALRHDLLVIEDAAQGLIADYRDRPLGSVGHLAALSFHETKNIISGEGGALLINDPRFVDRAEIIWEKGTNRSQFFRGQVDKYTWVDIGSSYLPGEIIAAFLWAQMEDAIHRQRLGIWATSRGIRRRALGTGSPADHLTTAQRPCTTCSASLERRTAFIDGLDRGIGGVPLRALHTSPSGDPSDVRRAT
jgi:dTDP-4-amino-4,6-dideoxygalactose transaminase